MKPLLVGLNNPHSPLPSMALVPYPPGCTGARLLDMIRLADPAFDDDLYLTAFDRTNVWKGRELPTGRGSMNLLLREGRRIHRCIVTHHRTAVILGAKAWAAVMNRTPPQWFECADVLGARIHYLPHPSGLNLIYNDDSAQRRAGALLLSLIGPRSITARSSALGEKK